jgi:large subunit ribosomal protein L23
MVLRTEARQLADLILKPIVTEKATLLLEQNKYVFDVAFELLFDVKVTKVNTSRPSRQKKRVGRFLGYKPQYKRAIVTLAEGDSIALYPDV